MKKTDPNIKPITFFEEPGYVYEQVYNPDKDLSSFIRFDKISEEAKDIPEIRVGEKTYIPDVSEWTNKRIVLLPSDIEEYDNIEELMKVIQAFIYKYLDVSDMENWLCACYVVLSWVYDNFETIPYLRFLGDYGTGKTRALKVVGSLSYKSIFAGGSTTPSPIFRLIEQYHGTLVIDEADFLQSDHSAEIIKILNCGYTKDIPVIRSEGNRTFTPRTFDVYSPKILASRKHYEDLALESRCLTIAMGGDPRSDIPYQLTNEFYSEALAIRNMLLLFRFKHYGSLKIDETLRIAGVEARINQITLPLFSIIEGETSRQRMRGFIIAYDRKLKTDRSEEPTAKVLDAIVRLKMENSTLSYKNVNESLFGAISYEISPAKIGKINSDLKFKTRKINGSTEIIWDEDLAKRLCVRFGLDSFEKLLKHRADKANKSQGLDL